MVNEPLRPADFKRGSGDTQRLSHAAADVAREALRVAHLEARQEVTARDVSRLLTPLDCMTLQRLGPASDARLTTEERLDQVLRELADGGEITLVTQGTGPARFGHFEATLRIENQTVASTVARPAVARPSQSRRQRTRALLTACAHHHARAVRFADVMRFGQSYAEWRDLSAMHIARDIQSLLRTGDVVVGREIVGGDADGYYFYLPTDPETRIALPLRVPSAPASWLEQVSVGFAACWTTECAAAAVEQRLPRPIATATLRAWLIAETDLPQAHDEKLVPNALGQLARATPPHVRRALRRPGSHYALWAPADVPDDALSLADAYVSDAARIIEATRRALARHAEPAVSRSRIEEETHADLSLAPVEYRSVAAVLADVSKPLVDSGDGDRRSRVEHLIENVGQADGEAYYTFVATRAMRRRAGREQDTRDTRTVDGATSASVQTARAFVHLVRATKAWAARDVEQQIAEVAECAGASVAHGRLLVLLHGVEQARATLGQLADRMDTTWPSAREAAETVVAEAYECAARARDAQASLRPALARTDIVSESIPHDVPFGLLSAHGVSDLVGLVPDRMIGFTADTLLGIVRARGYVRAARAVDPIELVPLLVHRLVRLPNAEFTGWRHEGAQYVFERTASLLLAATEWGGDAAFLYGAIARQELGQLRDPRYARSGLRDPQYFVRMASAASLAFLLPDHASETALIQAVRSDPDAGVRRAALWAYGAARSTDDRNEADRSPDDTLTALLEYVLETEDHPDVRALAVAAQACPRSAWWTV